MTPSSSMIEPGHPCVMMIGGALICDGFLVGPPGGRDAGPQRLQLRLRSDRDRERPDRRGAR
jgi:hypothetical protein